MRTDILLGCQWGDEGKAKMVDYLALNYDIVARFQGGANAGHTVIYKDEKFVFHLIPSGILLPKTVCVMGNGMVIDLAELVQEISMLEQRNITIKNRLKISDNAFLVLPIHKQIDSCREKKSKKIGSTGRGIGPAYEDKISRQGIRLCDLSDEDLVREKLKAIMTEKEALLACYGERRNTDVNQMFEELMQNYQVIKPYLTDTTFFLQDAMKKKMSILLEGAQGIGLDIDFGTYPFVTSSSCTSSGACQGTGISPGQIGRVFGLFKIYTTRVGEGVLPTQLPDNEMEELQKFGNEFGATTGRPRRCGWFDLVQAKHAVAINGVTDIILTKVDVLDDMETITIGTKYKVDGEEIDYLQLGSEKLNRVQPVYETFPGWKSSTSDITNWQDVPEALKKIVSFIEHSLERPVTYISVGPSRKQLIKR